MFPEITSTISLANIFMSQLDQKLYAEFAASQLLFYKRLVDDIFCILDGVDDCI